MYNAKLIDVEGNCIFDIMIDRNFPHSPFTPLSRTAINTLVAKLKEHGYNFYAEVLRTLNVFILNGCCLIISDSVSFVYAKYKFRA